MPVGDGNNYTLLISSEKFNLALKFPSIDTMEEEITRAMQVTYEKDLDEAAEDEFGEDEWGEDSDEEESQ